MASNWQNLDQKLIIQQIQKKRYHNGISHYLIMRLVYLDIAKKALCVGVILCWDWLKICFSYLSISLSKSSVLDV